MQIIFLAQYLLKNYGRDTRVTELVDKTDIWLMPSLNPDGFEKASEGNCYQVGLPYYLKNFLLKIIFNKNMLKTLQYDKSVQNVDILN